MSQHFPVLRRLMAWVLAKSAGDEISMSVVDYMKEKYSTLAKEKNKFWAIASCTIHFSLIFMSLATQNLIWRVMVYKNNLKISIRHLLRDKVYSFINVVGLSAGITCCIFIFLYLQYEMNFDSFHKDADRIYRITSSLKRPTGVTHYAGTSHQLTPYIRDNLRQSAWASRITLSHDCQVGYDDRLFWEQGKDIPYVDEEIFKILTFEFIYGDPGSALTRPKTIVITNQAAQKYFKVKNPLGKVLKIGNQDCEVTGVIKDPPGNSTFRFHILRSWRSLNPRTLYPRWLGNFHWTLLKLAPNVNPENFANLITRIIMNHSDQANSKSKIEYKSKLQPIKKVYLHSIDQIFERAAVGNVLYIYLFSGLGVFVLIIVSINFINLSTARSSKRELEISMRKIVGAQRRQLFTQLIGESLLITIISFGIAMMVVISLLYKFNQLAQTKIEISHLLRPGFLLTLLLASVILGVIAGIYPALFLSSFKPISKLRGSLKIDLKGKGLRKILIVGQYIFSIAMIIGVILFTKQLNFMKNMPLGFKNEQKLIINMQNTQVGRHNYISAKQELSNHRFIRGGTFSKSIPGRSQFHARVWPTGQQKTNSHNINWIDVDKDFLSVYGLKIVAGRNFSNQESSNQSKTQFIVNETAVKTFGWSSPEKILNKTFRDRPPLGYVVGVVKDLYSILLFEFA